MSERAVQTLCVLALNDGDTAAMDVFIEFRDDDNAAIATCCAEMLKYFK